MAEYIERGAAIQAAKHAWAKGIEPSQYIEIIPAADVVPVVRCKDCKYRADRLYCRLRETPYIVTNVDFCSFGVPRED